jgi:citrate lyase subunit beta/citryl-CoA lyase
VAIHPDQIGPINEAFSPSAVDVAWAQSVIAAFAESPGAGAISINGKMLDRPHYISAQRVLARASTDLSA